MALNRLTILNVRHQWDRTVLATAAFDFQPLSLVEAPLFGLAEGGREGVKSLVTTSHTLLCWCLAKATIIHESPTYNIREHMT